MPMILKSDSRNNKDNAPRLKKRTDRLCRARQPGGVASNMCDVYAAQVHLSANNCCKMVCIMPVLVNGLPSLRTAKIESGYRQLQMELTRK